MSKRTLIFGATLVGVVLLGYQSGFAQTALERISTLIGLQGKPIAASPARLSDHEVRELPQMTNQQQAERLLERAINHYEGAAEWIEKSVDGWRGSLKLTPQLNTLITSGLNAADLRVRACAIEIDLAALNLEKTPETVDNLILALESQRAAIFSNLWSLGLLGNRGVEPERVFQALLKYTRDGEVKVRYWAVEGLAYFGTDATVEPLLNIFRNDPSPEIRERAACSLAQSGMLRQSQRMKAVPALLNYLEDPAIDPTTHQWVLQALGDISGESLGDSVAAWRSWYSRQDVPAR
jgi:HEAT repeat protein